MSEEPRPPEPSDDAELIALIDRLKRASAELDAALTDAARPVTPDAAEEPRDTG